MTKKTKQNDNWTPKLRGDVYCSPACGGGCRWEDYNKAVKQGRKIARKLGKEWEPVIWENLGWHFKVVRGLIEVHQSSYVNGLYYASFRGTKQFDVHNCRSPEAALESLEDEARLFAANLLDEIHEAFGQPK